MPKLICTCDNVIDLSGIPARDMYRFISDVDFDNFAGMVEAEDIYAATKVIVKCNRCLRLHVFWNGSDQPATVYIVDRENESP